MVLEYTRRWVTEYANAADHGAPYVGPLLLASSFEDACALGCRVNGPNGEPLTIKGELMMQLDAHKHGDTLSIVRRPDDDEDPD